MGNALQQRVYVWCLGWLYAGAGARGKETSANWNGHKKHKKAQKELIAGIAEGKLNEMQE
jgi:hypothetical protein